MLIKIYYKLKNGAVISVDMNKIGNTSKGLLLTCIIENDLLVLSKPKMSLTREHLKSCSNKNGLRLIQNDSSMFVQATQINQGNLMKN